MGVLSCRHRGGVTTGTHSPTQSVYVLKNCKYWKLRPGSDAELFMSRTLYIEWSQMKSSASESIKNDGVFQFGTGQSREPRSLKTKTSKLCWPFNSERGILCGGLYRPPSSNTYYYWWTNWKEHWIRILEKQRNSYHRGLQHRLFKDSSIHA